MVRDETLSSRTQDISIIESRRKMDVNVNFIYLFITQHLSNVVTGNYVKKVPLQDAVTTIQ